MSFNETEFLEMSAEEQGELVFILHPELYNPHMEFVRKLRVIYNGRSFDYLEITPNLAFKMRDAFIEKHGDAAWGKAIADLAMVDPNINWGLGALSDDQQRQAMLLGWVSTLSPAEIIAAVLMAENNEGDK